jgi:hypothetical protein
MISQKDFIQPPCIANWLINLFASGPEAEPLLGDLLEEYSHLASQSGIAFARSWYWRQTRKTVAQLVGNALHAAPWLTAATVIGGLLLNRLVHGRSERAIFAVLFRYQVLDPNSNAWALFATIGPIIASLFIGCVVALAAKRRETVATVTLGAVLCAMTGAAVMLPVAKGQTSILWVLPWNVADWFAIMIGGAIVRMHRTAATRLGSAT